MSRVAVVIVSYNSARVMGRCLDSCAGLPVWVVDNGSADETVELVRARGGARLIANGENAGFAAALNQGVRACGEEYILCLNPDVELLDSPLGLVQGCERTGAGIAGGRLAGEDGRDQRGFTLRRFPSAATLAFEALGWNRLFPWNPVNRRYRELGRDPDREGEAEQPPGAFLLFRRAVWERLGGFDERFHPLWFEDVDFCRRASAMGVKIYYFAGVKARHQGGHSLRSVAWESREAQWYVSLLKYASKHFRRSSFRAVSAAVVLGSMLRIVPSTVRRLSLKPIAVYGSVASHAIGCFISGRV